MTAETTESFDKFSNNYKEVIDSTLRLFRETSDYFAYYKAQFAQKLLGKNFSGRILDYGCGVGLVSDCFTKVFPDATVDGFDVSALSIDQVPSELLKRGRYVSDPAMLEPGYKAIILANVCHHASREARKDIFARIRHLLADDGIFLIFEHNPLNPLTQWVVRHSILDRGVSLLRCRELSREVTEKGLVVSQHQYIVFFPSWIPFARPFEKFLKRIPFGAQYVIIGGTEYLR